MVTISCVIPTYKSGFLLARCLASIVSQDGPLPEIIISDDSSDAQVSDLVAQWQKAYPTLRYQPGPRTSNAADNWNAAIAAASNDYVILVHHDEFFARPDYLTAVARTAAERPGTCVQVRSDIFGTLRKSRFRSMAKVADRLGRPAWTLYASNWIGPTATFAFPKAIGLAFDRNIKSLIDVDFYFQAIERNGIVVLDDVYVYSIAHAEQISVHHDLTNLNRQEIRYIKRRGTAINDKQYQAVRAVLWLRDAISSISPVLQRRRSA